jgi:hypothetical protein
MVGDLVSCIITSGTRALGWSIIFGSCKGELAMELANFSSSFKVSFRTCFFLDKFELASDKGLELYKGELYDSTLF